MYREDYWEEGFYQDNYVKYECVDCGKTFIVGEALTKDCAQGFPICPYCGNRHVKWVSATEDEQLRDMDLGCIGIYIENQHFL